MSDYDNGDDGYSTPLMMLRTIDFLSNSLKCYNIPFKIHRYVHKYNIYLRLTFSVNEWQYI